MNPDFFARDPRDRKRRFLRGLNRILGLDWQDLENTDALLRDAVQMGRCGGVAGLRNRLANIYCLEFTRKELEGMLASDMTTGEFTKKYVATIYKYRGRVDLNNLIGESTKTAESGLVVDLSEIDRAPKYGLNGSEWCDVAGGPCNCGAWH